MNEIATSTYVVFGAKIVASPVLLCKGKNNFLLPFMLHLEGKKAPWVHSISSKLVGGR